MQTTVENCFLFCFPFLSRIISNSILSLFIQKGLMDLFTKDLHCPATPDLILCSVFANRNQFKNVMFLDYESQCGENDFFFITIWHMPIRNRNFFKFAFDYLNTILAFKNNLFSVLQLCYGSNARLLYTNSKYHQEIMYYIRTDMLFEYSFSIKTVFLPFTSF